MLHAGVSIFLLFNIYFNYALCIATDPVRSQLNFDNSNAL